MGHPSPGPMMTSSDIQQHADIQQRATRIRLLALDVDGTLTDGQLWFGSDGTEVKAFSVLDGMGLKLLRDHGIEVALITARQSRVVQLRARELGLVHVHQGSHDKLQTLQAVCRELGIDLSQAAFMGDDLPDLPALRVAGLATAPSNAHPWVAARVHWQSQARGGHGAVRELCDLLLTAQGKVDAVLAHYWPTP